MAIDFFIMPLSRYVSGAFITPTMRFAWSQGLPYTLMGPQGTRQLPPDVPFGGPDAESRRAQYLASGLLPQDLAKYPPPIPSQLWDEASAAEPRFHRVDPGSYQALLQESEGSRFTRKKGLFGFGKQTVHTHVGAAVYFPVAFDEPFLTEHIFMGWRAGSVQTALEQLAATPGTAASAAARATLRDALTDAAELRFPMVVDA